MIYPSLYNGPVNYYARLVREKEIQLEVFENYSKQTYRNRCTIMGPNGRLNLTVPVKKNNPSKTHFREIRIDYDTSWQKVHLRSLKASYASSPFYEYMMDDLEYFYHCRLEFLADLNRQLIERCLRLLGVTIPVSESESFTAISGNDDPRQFITPKLDPLAADPYFVPVTYHQVFADRHGFMPNLSILDLLFNQGPDALSVLSASLRT